MIRALSTALVIADPELKEEIGSCLAGAPLRIVLDQSTTIETAQLRRMTLDLVVVAGTPPGETMDALVKRIKAVSPESAVMVLDRSPEPEVILESMRAGADEFILPPFVTNLPEGLNRILAQSSKRELALRPTGKVAAFMSAKGGCGATTAACHIAAELQRITEHEILLADFDIESGVIGYLMKSKTQYNVLDAVRNLQRMDMSYWKALVAKEGPRLDVLPAPEGVPSREGYQPEQVREVLHLMRSMYAWVVADFGRSLSLLSMTLLDDFDELFLFSTLSVPAMYQAKRFVEQMRDYGYPLSRVHLIVNRVPQNPEFAPADFGRALGLAVYATLPEGFELEQAYAEGTLLPPDCALGKELASIAMKMAGVQEPGNQQPRRYLFFGARKPVPALLGLDD